MRNLVGKRPSAGSERAFSLIEILIAAAIFSVAMLGIAGLFPTGSSFVDDGGMTSQALAFAQQKMEELKNTPFPPTGSSDTTFVGPKQLKRTWTVSLSGSAPNRLATVTVAVTWSGTRSRSIQLMTMLTEP